MDRLDVTKVVFRRLKTHPQQGEVIALFPQEAVSAIDATLCSSYMRVGQHGAADPAAMVNQSSPATEAEYASLKRELEHFGPPGEGYVFQVAKRCTRRDFEARQSQVADWRAM